MEIDKKKGISIDHCHFVFSIPKTLHGSINMKQMAILLGVPYRTYQN